ncbi:MAG: response regulator, partial [Pseudomonadota bacterium]|nr:response regulator [Pseudomonadota bacterium]
MKDDNEEQIKRGHLSMTSRSKILIVDDELSMRMRLESMLKTENYDIISLGNGKELLERLADLKP